MVRGVISACKAIWAKWHECTVTEMVRDCSEFLKRALYRIRVAFKEEKRYYFKFILFNSVLLTYYLHNTRIITYLNFVLFI